MNNCREMFWMGRLWQQTETDEKACKELGRETSTHFKVKGWIAEQIREHDEKLSDFLKIKTEAK